MAGAGGAAGPAQDVRHQPPGSTEYIYHKPIEWMCSIVYLHFMLVVEAIKLNRIIDLCMSLDFDVQQIYGLAQIS